MLKVIAILAAIVAATPSYAAQEVRVFSGDFEHIYGPGGQLRDSPELRAKNQRAAERQMRQEEFDQRTITVETSRRQTPLSWWNQVPQQPPLSWWSDFN